MKKLIDEKYEKILIPQNIRNTKDVKKIRPKFTKTENIILGCLSSYI